MADALTNAFNFLNYDLAGNVIADGTHGYTYDAEGNILNVDNGSTATYVYDAFNHRVRETINTPSVSSDTYYTFNTDGQRVSSWTAGAGTPSLLSAYTYWNGRPLATYSSTATFYSHQDLLGTKRLTTNASGTPIGTFASLPFGDGYTPTGTDPDPSHFAMLDHDAESNTDHAQARQYNSTPGTWMSPDPYDGSYDHTNPQSFNRYVYAGNNPLMYIDPDGLDPCVFFGGAPISSLDGCDAKADIYGAAFGQPPPNPTQLGLDAIAEYESYSSRASGRDEALYVEALEENDPDAPKNGNPANPCSTANPNNLDYTSANAQQHILQNHTAGGRGPGIYVGDWTAIQLINQATLTMGTRDPSQLLRDTSSGTYTLQWTAPPMMWPLSLIFTNNIGWSSPGNPTPTNRLVVTTNCSTVVTSYPIP